MLFFFLFIVLNTKEDMLVIKQFDVAIDFNIGKKNNMKICGYRQLYNYQNYS